MTEAGNIFREVAQAAGDIVFKYDLKTKKFMQYSDRSELSKYGSWLQDFDMAMVNAKMIKSEDVESFLKLTTRIKRGESGTIEGIFRMRLHISSDYRWYRLIARTKYDCDGPVEVLGRVTDINNYMTSKEHSDSGAGHRIDMIGFSDYNTVINEAVRYMRKHEADIMLACILFDIPEYDNIICRLGRGKSEELLINLIRRIRRSFPHGTLLSRVGIHRFAIFTGGLATISELGEAVTKSIHGIEELGEKYDFHPDGKKLAAYVGIDVESNVEGVESVIYDRAILALEAACCDENDDVVFFRQQDASNDLGSCEARSCEAASSEQEDMIAEYVIDLLGEEAVDDEFGEEEIRAHVMACMKILLEKVAIRYGFERVSISICRDGIYKRYTQWADKKVEKIPDGCLLYIEGDQKSIENKVTFWEPYMVNDTYAYPDSSEYGRMVGLSAVRSFAQAGFECSNGVRGIVSFEFYSRPHVWKPEEINAFNTVKYVADFCARYIEESR